MMKRVCVLFAFMAAVSFVLIGCSSGSGNDDGGIETPTVGSAADLTASGGTSPTSPTEATTLFTGACTALNTVVASQASASVRSIRDPISARATTTQGEPINIKFTPADGGTVTCTGTWSAISTYPDKTWTPTANATYNDLIAIVFNITVNGTMNDVVVKDSSYTYKINGLIKNIMSETANIDVTTGSAGTSNATMNLDFSLGVGIGTAFSIRRSDGVGAKFLITYGANYAKNDIDISTMSSSAFSSEMESYLKSQPATLKVYNDKNEVVYETTLTASDAYSTSILSHFGE